MGTNFTFMAAGGGTPRDRALCQPSGVPESVLGVQMRRTGRTVQAVLHDAA
jgi:hypothetical protein